MEVDGLAGVIGTFASYEVVTGAAPDDMTGITLDEFH
jgi:hypothetical protein